MKAPANARLSSLLLPIALLLAWMVLPLLVMLLLQLPEWIYAEGDHGTPFFWKHIDIIVALGWAGLFLRLALSSPDFQPSEWLKRGDFRSLGVIAFFMLFFSWLAGDCIGGLAFGLVNCTLDRSEGEEAKIKDVKSEARSVSFRIDAPSPATFRCGQGTMIIAHNAGRTRFFVHPGRLGVTWGEFR